MILIIIIGFALIMAGALCRASSKSSELEDSSEYKDIYS